MEKLKPEQMYTSKAKGLYKQRETEDVKLKGKRKKDKKAGGSKDWMKY